MVTSRLVGLFKLPVEDFRVIHTVSTLQGTHSNHFVDVIDTFIIYLGDLIFLNKNL